MQPSRDRVVAPAEVTEGPVPDRLHEALLELADHLEKVRVLLRPSENAVAGPGHVVPHEGADAPGGREPEADPHRPTPHEAPPGFEAYEQADHPDDPQGPQSGRRPTQGDERHDDARADEGTVGGPVADCHGNEEARQGEAHGDLRPLRVDRGKEGQAGGRQPHGAGEGVARAAFSGERGDAEGRKAGAYERGEEAHGVPRGSAFQEQSRPPDRHVVQGRIVGRRRGRDARLAVARRNGFGAFLGRFGEEDEAGGVLLDVLELPWDLDVVPVVLEAEAMDVGMPLDDELPADHRGGLYGVRGLVSLTLDRDDERPGDCHEEQRRPHETEMAHRVSLEGRRRFGEDLGK